MNPSPAEAFILRLARELGRDGAHRFLDMAMRQLPALELAGLEWRWGFWCRPVQEIPTEAEWRSWVFCGGRGTGKTRPCAEFVVAEAQAGRAQRVALVGPTDDDVRKVQVEGQSGLLACSPPWFPARFEPGTAGGRVVWPNGATAFMYSAEAPERFRGPEHHLAWCTELGAWPERNAETAWYNLSMGLRLGYARLIGDTTPRTVPLVARLLARGKSHPEHHRVVRGRMVDNWSNLPPAFVEEQIAAYGGTRLGLQELEGEYLEAIEGALFQQAWIAAARAHAPTDWILRAIAVDPAISQRGGRDDTGIVRGGLAGGRVYVTKDETGRYPPEQWAIKVLDAYLEDWCSMVVLERNRGGDMPTALLRAAAKDKGIEVRIWKSPTVKAPRAGPPPPHDPRIVYVVEVHARRSKDERAMPVAGRYERGQVVHVIGADLADLETELTTWDPTARDSPDRLDALVHLVWELLELGQQGRPDPAETIAGLLEAQAKLTAGAARVPTVGPSEITRVRGAYSGGRI